MLLHYIAVFRFYQKHVENSFNLPVVIQFLARRACNWRKYNSYNALVTKKEQRNDTLIQKNQWNLLLQVYLAGAAATLRCFQPGNKDFLTSLPKSSWLYRHLSHHSRQIQHLIIKITLRCLLLPDFDVYNDENDRFKPFDTQVENVPWHRPSILSNFSRTVLQVGFFRPAFTKMVKHARQLITAANFNVIIVSLGTKR